MMVRQTEAFLDWVELIRGQSQHVEAIESVCRDGYYPVLPLLWLVYCGAKGYTLISVAEVKRFLGNIYDWHLMHYRLKHMQNAAEELQCLLPEAEALLRSLEEHQANLLFSALGRSVVVKLQSRRLQNTLTQVSHYFFGFKLALDQRQQKACRAIIHTQFPDLSEKLVCLAWDAQWGRRQLRARSCVSLDLLVC
jgi:hypothetical protein